MGRVGIMNGDHKFGNGPGLLTVISRENGKKVSASDTWIVNGQPTRLSEGSRFAS